MSEHEPDPQQRGSSWCKTAAPSEITEALARGALSELLQGRDVDDRQPDHDQHEWRRAPTAGDIANAVVAGQRTAEQHEREHLVYTDAEISAMTPEELVAAAREGNEDLRRRLPSITQPAAHATTDPLLAALLRHDQPKS